jgi:inosine-uridine nucleoside N-ribohydrolase
VVNQDLNVVNLNLALHYYCVTIADGINDVQFPIHDNVCSREPAAMAIVRLLRENPGQLSLACLGGPLTNICCAIKLDEAIKPKECLILGGTTTGICQLELGNRKKSVQIIKQLFNLVLFHIGLGTVTICSDFNTIYDVEASKATIEQLNCPKTLFTKEARATYTRLPPVRRILYTLFV